MSASRIQVYQYFQTDDIPTESQFQYLFNNLWFKDEKFPILQIEGLTEMFQGTMSSQAFQNHLLDTGAHTGYLALKDASNLTAANVNEWKSRLNISYAATVDGTGQPGNVYTKEQIQEIVNALNIQDDEAIQLIENIREMLTSDDVNLDELQEVINYIKQNREQIELLQQVLVGTTTDDKVQLTGTYTDWGVNYQNHFNESVYDRVRHLEQELEQLNSERFTIEIPNQQTITHNLNTFDFVVDAYDTVSLYTLPIVVKRIDLNTAEVQFDSTPNQPVKVTFRKI